MTTIYDFLMMQQMQKEQEMQQQQSQQQGQQQPPAGAGMPLNVLENHIAQGSHAPSYNEYDRPSPIQRGVMEGYKAAHPQFQPRTPRPQRNWLGNLVNDVSVGMLRGGDNAQAQEIGKSFKTTEEEEELENARFMEQEERTLKSLQYLQEAEKMRKMHEYHMASTSEHALGRREQERHHREEERLRGEHYAVNDKKLLKEEELERKNEELQEKLPGARLLALETTGARTQITKELLRRINKPARDAKTLNTMTEMVNIVARNPGLSTSLAAMLQPGPKSGAFYTALSKALPSERDRKDFELMKKFASTLTTSAAENLGARSNQFIQMMNEAANPNGTLHPDTVVAIHKNALKGHKYDIADSKLANQAYQLGANIAMLEPDMVPLDSEVEADNQAARQSEKEALLAIKAQRDKERGQ